MHLPKEASAPFLSRPRAHAEWEMNAWWHVQADQLPARPCGKQSGHGIARTRYETSKFGRVLAYQCVVCGWEQTVLVQEGNAPPCAPAPAELPRMRPPRMTRGAAQRKERRVW